MGIVCCSIDLSREFRAEAGSANLLASTRQKPTLQETEIVNDNLPYQGSEIPQLDMIYIFIDQLRDIAEKLGSSNFTFTSSLNGQACVTTRTTSGKFDTSDESLPSSCTDCRQKEGQLPDCHCKI